MSQLSTRTPTPKPEECYSCGFLTEALTWYAIRQGGWLCLVCANTPAGNAYHYPDQHRGQAETLRTLAWGINYLAERIEVATSPPT